MRTRRSADDDAEADREDETPEVEERPAPRRTHRRAAHRARPAPQPWSVTGDEPSEDAPVEDDEPGWLHRPKRPVFYRARDAWWFEPLIALMIVVLLLVGLYAYTQNWPPMYVVESSSMQHGTNDNVGLINTGDLVLAQQVPTSSIVPYVVAQGTGYKTYGEYGDVLLYHPNGVVGPAPIIHRTLTYLQYSGNGTFSDSELAGLPCGPAPNSVYVSSGPGGCGTNALRGTLELLGIGWQSVSVNITLSQAGRHSGFVTMGDNNIDPGTSTGDEDQPGLSELVEPGWIVGVARGMIPWVGSLKLLLSGTATEVPSQSWQFLGLSIVALFAIGYGVHYALRVEGIEDDRRKAIEEEEAAEDPHPSRFRGLRHWLTRSDDDEEPDDLEVGTADSSARPSRSKRRHGGPSGGRPRPSVRRGDDSNSKHGRSRPPGGDAEDL
ncbi:MAG TPA: S26 family signal peptidase [Thermoplasmata archaeon]|nr:S26 family signal peptidase [Thermoplasmata archaeon]